MEEHMQKVVVGKEFIAVFKQFLAHNHTPHWELCLFWSVAYVVLVLLTSHRFSFFDAGLAQHVEISL